MLSLINLEVPAWPEEERCPARTFPWLAGDGGPKLETRQPVRKRLLKWRDPKTTASSSRARIEGPPDRTHTHTERERGRERQRESESQTEKRTELNP